MEKDAQILVQPQKTGSKSVNCSFKEKKGFTKNGLSLKQKLNFPEVFNPKSKSAHQPS